MSIIIEPIGLLKRYCGDRRNGEDKLVLSDAEEGRSLDEVCRDLGLPIEMISLFVVDGRKVPRSYRIRPGDTVKCVAVIGGG